MWFLSTLLMAAILWAATAKQSSILKLYFVTQFVATAAGEICLQFCGWQSPTYLWVYGLGSLFMLMAAGVIVLYHDVRRREFFVALAFALALGRVAYSGMPHPLSAANWILLLEGGGLAFLGTALGFKAPYLRQKIVVISLAVLWQLAALLDFGLLLNHNWTTLNETGSYALFITAFLWIGAKQRKWI